MIELIFLIIFIISLGGIILISLRKMPVLVKLPQNGKIGIREHHVVSNIENRIKNIFVYFEKQIFLHKFLSWVKIMTLKTENKIDTHLHRIRKKAQKMDRELKDKK
jgi:fructose-specific phosphotransferase system component IIB